MLVVERATEDDLTGILSLHRALKSVTVADADLMTAVRNRHCWIAREGTMYRGYALAKPTLFDRWFIHLIAIHPDYREQAVDTALVHYLLKTCPDDRLFACVRVDDAAGCALYEGMGFIHSGDLSRLIDDSDVRIYYKSIG